MEDRDDIGMVDRRRDVALSLETRTELAILGELRRYQLQRDGTVELEFTLK